MVTNSKIINILLFFTQCLLILCKDFSKAAYPYTLGEQTQENRLSAPAMQHAYNSIYGRRRSMASAGKSFNK